MISRILLLLFLSISIAQGQTQSALYKIEGNGLETPSYLFGTINFVPKFGYIIPPEVKEALSNSQVFVTKSGLDNKSQRKFNEAAQIPDNGTVDKYLTEEEVRKLKAIIEEYGGKSAYKNFYSKLQPVLLVTATSALTLQYNIAYPVRELQELAEDKKMKFKNLGDVEAEIEAFSKFPVEDQIEALKYTINNFDQHIKDYKNMVSAYLKKQDMDAVAQETFKAMNNSEAFKKAYFDDRSAAWLPQIEKLIDSKPTFIALGVPHITGKGGLVDLLRREGYTVEPVLLNFVPPKTSN